MKTLMVALMLLPSLAHAKPKAKEQPKPQDFVISAPVAVQKEVLRIKPDGSVVLSVPEKEAVQELIKLLIQSQRQHDADLAQYRARVDSLVVENQELKGKCGKAK